jgi:hypothetical protein
MSGVTAGPDRTEPANPPPPAETPPLTQATQAIGAMPGAGGESCPNCGVAMSGDQRYCLNCGHRRGDPRLPFMDAVVFMEAMGGAPGGTAAAAPPPPPPAERKPRFSPSASLIAGVATLVLAVGVGVLIGRSGNSGSSDTPGTQVIRVQNEGGSEETANAETAGEGAGKAGGATKGKQGKGAGKNGAKAKSNFPVAKKAEAKAETGDSGTAKAVEEVIKPEAGVKIAPPEQKLGGACEEGIAGCTAGKFEGNFFE